MLPQRLAEDINAALVQRVGRVADNVSPQVRRGSRIWGGRWPEVLARFGYTGASVALWFVEAAYRSHVQYRAYERPTAKALHNRA